MTKEAQNKRGIDSCATGGGLPVAQAQQAILKACTSLQGFEKLPLPLALHRYLAHDLIAKKNVPPHDNSAMDGYAMTAAQEQRPRQCVGHSYAGRPYTGTLQAGQCVAITTGAQIPLGADCVVAIENIRLDGEDVIPTQQPKAGANIRRIGEDIRVQDCIIAAGSLLQPAQLGLMASLGIAEPALRRQPRVALLSTGDELQPLGQTLQEGQIYDSNRYSLNALLRLAGALVSDAGILSDTPDIMQQRLIELSQQSDVIISSGGVSVGSADYMEQALRECGQAIFSKVAIKPGRPMNFGRIGSAIFFGLPGNPVAALVCFHCFVRPALTYLASDVAHSPLRLQARSLSHLQKQKGRSEYQRGFFSSAEKGSLCVTKTGQQGSGVLRSLSEANCLIVLEDEDGPVKPGDSVLIEPLPTF